ncbi:MAG: hypothetical protein PHV82_09020 [Victivallaceae bacterium]|nr:hypothetical protein [Victivallaceae bacterium]
MRKNVDTVSVLLGALTLNLMIITGIIFYQEYRVSNSTLLDHPAGALLFIIILVLLLQILILFRRKRERGGTLIFADLDMNGIPEKIFEVSEQDVVRFCKADFSMVFRIEYWPSFRKQLLEERKNNTPEGRIASQLYREGCGMTEDFLAVLEYTDKQGRHATLSRLAMMPTSVDGAIEIIRAAFLKTWVFHTPQELAMWESEIPVNRRPQFRIQINKFLRQRAKKVG